MTFNGQDYLSRPPHLENQSTPNDVSFAQTMMMQGLLTGIYDELCRLNPSVMCYTNVEGGNSIGDTLDHTVRFLQGGKPVEVYKVIMWTNSAKAIRVSVNSMATGADGFTVPTTQPLVLHLPVSELTVALNVAGTIGVNVPSGINTDGSVFIYGFTTPTHKEINY